MKKYKPKYKNKRTITITPASQTANILRVMAVSGEIGEQSFKLFGVSGKNNAVKYGDTKRKLLEEAKYLDKEKHSLFEGTAFNRRGKAQEKTIRISQNAYPLFNAVAGGEYFNTSYQKHHMPSDRTHIVRNIQLADWCIFCQRSKIDFNPLFNPTLYNLGGYYSGGDKFRDTPTGEKENGKRPVLEAMFYSTREINRRDGAGRLCCKGSRVVGNLVKPEGVFVCYSIPKTKMVWRAVCERTMLEYTKTYFGSHNFDVTYNVTSNPSALCLAESYEKAEQVVFAPPFNFKGKKKKAGTQAENEALPENDQKDRYKLFSSLFDNVCIFPKNEDGIKQFKFFSIPNVNKKTVKLLINNRADELAALSCGYDCDGYNEDEHIATLFFFNGCVTRLNRCAEALKASEGTKSPVRVRVVCFPWQSEYVKRVMGSSKRCTICTEEFEDMYTWVSKIKI